MRHRIRAIVAIVMAIALGAPTPTAHAGCGCAKPPPPLASVRPAFASAGSEISLFAPGLTEGTEYQITFRSASGAEAMITATPIVRRDYADAVLKPQLVIDVPAGAPGPTAISVALDGVVVLDIPETDFTRLQKPIELTENNAETISKCYKAAVGSDGTVYFPLDVSAIGKRTIFSGAAKGYRFTFEADDITIYNRQGILMQTLGPEEAGIFTIGDDELGDGLIHTETFIGDPRSPSSTAFGNPAQLANSSTSARIDFDPSPAGELYQSFDLFPDDGPVHGRSSIGTGMPATGAVEFAPTEADERAVAILEASWRKLRRAGDEVGISADVRFPDSRADSSAAVSVHSNWGGVAMFGVRPNRDGALEVFVDAGWGPFVWRKLSDQAKFTTNWLRLSVVLTYNGDNIEVSGVVFDIGRNGTDPQLAIAQLTGTFDNYWLERNKKIQRGFGVVADSGSPQRSVVHFDNFVDGAIHDANADFDVHPDGYPDDSTDPVEPGDDPDPETDPDGGYEPPDDGSDPGVHPDDGPGINPNEDDPSSPGTDATDGGDDGTDGDTDPSDGGTDGDDGSEPDADTDTDDDAAVDEAVRSFRLTYDRHEFLSYETLHAMNADYFLDPSDPEWHADESRHIDHDHLIIAVRGLVDGTFPPPAGQTPPFNLHLTTMLADAPLSPGTPPRVLTNDCGGDTNAVPVTLCQPTPQSECRGPAKAHKSTLTLKDAKKDGGDALVWTWAKGQATTIEDFGDPMTTDSPAVCIYDESGNEPALVFEGTAPAGATCGTHEVPCWRAIGKRTAVKRYAYKDPDRASDGIAEVLLKPGKEKKSKIVVKGKGANLTLPALPLALPTRVQLRTTNGGCWEATYSEKGTRKNSTKRFKARAD